MPQVAYNSNEHDHDERSLAAPFEAAPFPGRSKRRGAVPARAATRRNRNYWADPALHETVSCPRVKPLGYLTEARLIERAQNGDVAARNTVWCNHLRLAMKVVNAFHIPTPLLPDAFQEAAIGLHEAIMRYEVRRFLSFSTYAWYWMTQRVRRVVASQRNSIRIPDYLQQQFARFCHERKKCRDSGEWFDWFDAWSSRDPRMFVSLLRVYRLTHEPPSMLELIEEPAIDAQGHGLSTDEKSMVHSAVGCLPERERRIIERRFGLDGSSEATLEAIAQNIGRTRERVRQIQQKAMSRLCRRLAGLDRRRDSHQPAPGPHSAASPKASDTAVAEGR